MVLNDRKTKTRRKRGKNANAELAALVALPGETIVAFWSRCCARVFISGPLPTYNLYLKRAKGQRTLYTIRFLSCKVLRTSCMTCHDNYRDGVLLTRRRRACQVSVGIGRSEPSTYAVVTPAGGVRIRPSRVDSSLVLSVVTTVVETRGCRGASEVGDDGSGEALHDFGSWGRSGFVYRIRWGRFFWLVRRRSDGRRDLSTDFERRRSSG